MLIGELSEKTGLTRDTIRFYEKQGLITVEERRPNSYKEYSEETMNRLFAIKKLKGFGFTLNEASEFLTLIKLNSASCEKVSLKMDEKVSLIDQKIEELKEMRTSIVEGVNNCPAQSPSQNCPILKVD